MRIDIWSDIACPWCLIGKKRFDRALEGLDFADQLQVAYHSFQLDPTLPDHYEGTECDYLCQSKGMSVDQVREMFGQVGQVAAGEGLRYDFDRVVVANSRLAHRLVQGARILDQSGDTAGLQPSLQEALLRAHFEQGRDIGDVEQLVEIAAGAGMDAEAARQVLGEETMDQAVQMDLATAAQLQLTAVPFYVIDQKYGIAGAEQPEVFVEALTQAWQEHQAEGADEKRS